MGGFIEEGLTASLVLERGVRDAGDIAGETQQVQRPTGVRLLGSGSCKGLWTGRADVWREGEAQKGNR